jgi:putative membrane protein
MRAIGIWAITTVAVALAVFLVPGIEVWEDSQAWGGGWMVSIISLAAVLAILNTFLKPILQAISLPITCLTLGLFAFVVNTALLYLSAWLSNVFGAGVYIDNFFSALLASLVISIVTAVLGSLVGINNKNRERR